MGIIKSTELRQVHHEKGDFDVLDIHIDSETIDVKAGFFAKVYPVSELGKLLVMFGFDASKFGSADVDVDKLLLGKKIQFKSETTKAPNGKYYSNIVVASIMPVQ